MSAQLVERARRERPTIRELYLRWTPDTAVPMALNSPPVGRPGLGSKVSMWLGPPAMYSRMQALCLVPFSAAWAASTGSQPDAELRPTPAAVRQECRDMAAVELGRPVQGHL